MKNGKVSNARIENALDLCMCPSGKAILTVTYMILTVPYMSIQINTM